MVVAARVRIRYQLDQLGLKHLRSTARQRRRLSRKRQWNTQGKGGVSAAKGSGTHKAKAVSPLLMAVEHTRPRRCLRC